MTVVGLEHVLVLSDDIEASREFYTEVVGLVVGDRPPLEFPGYWLYAGGVPCVHIADRCAYLEHAARLGLRESAGPVDHVAFNGTDYDALCSRVERCEVPAVRNFVPNGGPRQLFIEDPSGVRIEINVRR